MSEDRLPKLHKLYEMDPEDAFITYGIAMEYSKIDQHEQAIVWFDKTLVIDASYCYAYFQKGKSLSTLGHTADAKACLEAGIQAAQKSGDGKALGELQELLAAM